MVLRSVRVFPPQSKPLGVLVVLPIVGHGWITIREGRRLLKSWTLLRKDGQVVSELGVRVFLSGRAPAY